MTTKKILNRICAALIIIVFSIVIYNVIGGYRIKHDIENNGKIILSDTIEDNAYKKIGVTGNETIKNLSQYNFQYLERHRNSLIK